MALCLFQVTRYRPDDIASGKGRPGSPLMSPRLMTPFEGFITRLELWKSVVARYVPLSRSGRILRVLGLVALSWPGKRGIYMEHMRLFQHCADRKKTRKDTPQLFYQSPKAFTRELTHEYE